MFSEAEKQIARIKIAKIMKGSFSYESISLATGISIVELKQLFSNNNFRG